AEERHVEERVVLVPLERRRPSVDLFPAPVRESGEPLERPPNVDGDVLVAAAAFAPDRRSRDTLGGERYRGRGREEERTGDQRVGSAVEAHVPTSGRDPETDRAQQ